MRQRRIRPALLLWALLFAHAGAAWAERADRDKPVHIEADQLTIDDAHQRSIFMGNVVMTQGTLTITGDQAVATQDRRGLEHGTLTGKPATFRQKREGLDEYVDGSGLRIEYDAVTGIMDIYGQAHVKRGQDDVRGEHISYNPRTEIFQVFGQTPEAASTTPSAPGKPGKVFVIIQPPKAASAVPPAEPLSIKRDTRLLNPETKP